MNQLDLFQKLPDHILMDEWYREHIKNPPPQGVTSEQKETAQQKINQLKSLRQRNTIKTI